MFIKTRMGPSYMILKVIVIFTSIVSLNSVTWGNEMGKGGKGEKVSTKGIQEVLEDHAPELMSTPGVVGTGLSLCNDQPCIKVFVVKETPELKEKIPDTLEGYPVVIEESGTFRALPKRDDR